MAKDVVIGNIDNDSIVKEWDINDESVKIAIKK